MSKKKKGVGNSDLWKEAILKCRLNLEEIEMAKKLGLNPRKLIANAASLKHEPWKEPVGNWLREIYKKRFKD